MQKHFVDIIYRDEKLEPTWRKTYTLDEYVSMQKMDLFRLITDVEDLVYALNDYKPRSEWSDDAWSRFQAIRHKMLDKAGDIGRLSDTIRTAEVMEGESIGQSHF